MDAEEDADRAKDDIRRLLGCSLRFTLDDDRVILGVFECMDRHRNFIVGKAEERRRLPVKYSLDESILEERTRRLGLVMIPGKHLVRVEAMANDWDRTALDQATVNTSENAPLEDFSKSA